MLGSSGKVLYFRLLNKPVMQEDEEIEVPEIELLLCSTLVQGEFIDCLAGIECEFNYDPNLQDSLAIRYFGVTSPRESYAVDMIAQLSHRVGVGFHSVASSDLGGFIGTLDYPVM